VALGLSAREDDLNKLAPFLGICVVLCLVGAPLLAEASHQSSARRWHFQLSVFGGFESGASFIHHFRLYSDREMTLWYNDDHVSDAWTKADARFVPGASLGVQYELSRVIGLYAKFSYFLPVKFADGIEETVQTFDIADTATYGQVANYAQTSRKAQAFGLSLGTVLTPLARVPVGLDIELGLWRYSQEFLSGSCQKYDQDAVFTSIENRNVLDGRDVGEYLGQGKWREKHLCLLAGLGLKYYPLRWVALDLGWRTLGYFKAQSTGLVFADSGRGVTHPKWYTAASLLSAGLTFSF
jgi:hypothetical protein